jgi:hypothetical protein
MLRLADEAERRPACDGWTAAIVNPGARIGSSCPLGADTQRILAIRLQALVKTETG